jgi:hypothetical protein
VRRLLTRSLRVTTLSSPRLKIRNNVVRVFVEEDRVYEWFVLENLFRAHKLGSLYNEFVENLKSFLKTYCKLVIEACKESKLDVFDIVLPRIGKEKVLFGEFVGEHIIGSFDDKVFVLVVEPKVGWSAYKRMVVESLEIPAILGTRGVLKPLLANASVFGIYSPISYSLLLTELTLQILSSSLPRAVEEYKIISGGVVGKPDPHDTYILMSRGFPLAVFRRLRIRVVNAPLMLLARFHEMLAQDLQQLLKVVVERFPGREEVINSIVEEIHRLIDVHTALIWATELREHLIAFHRMGLAESKLVEEAYREAGFNTLLKQVIDLFVEYLNKVTLIHRFGESKLNPIPSNKLYELWILSKLIEYLKNLDKTLNIRRATDMYLSIEANGVTLHYNLPRMRKLKIASLAPKARLRPDYTIRVGKDGEIVMDAKYKRRIELEDIERLATYIIEFAKPVKNKLYATIITLQDTETGKEKGSRNRALGTEIEVEILRIDPRQRDKEIRDTLNKITMLFA